REPELPVRRRLDPHHRGCRPRDGEADRRPAAAATLRRTPAMTSTPTSPDRNAPAAAATQAARLVIVGPQGSGKGTQGVRIAESLGIPAISTGDLFRAAVKDGTELGQQVKAVIEAGDLVTDALTF